ncbi:hypothetical protein GGS20DRAFT_105340 [Poronia punctata]|nr:hypothetical protein GGS20DRAFT_105340 [Poronia punctata]
MRLRQSNQQKRFEPPDYAADIDADNTLARVDSSDDDFVIDDARDFGDEEEQLVDDALDEVGDDHRDVQDKGSNRRRTLSSTTKGKRREHTRLKQTQPSSVNDGFVEVPPYPSDPGQRWTRSYVGPIKRWTRFYELIDWWFGDKMDRRAVLDGYLKLWWEHPLIPPKLLSSGQLVTAQSGWMGKDFTNNQRSKFCQLYDAGLVHQFRQQDSTPIDRERAFRWFIPKAQGELSVLLGHVTDQKQHRIGYGQSIPLSDAGSPIVDTGDEESTTGGWLFDVGGIPTSVAWAPAQGQVDQLLAVAVTPFSDQAYYQDLKDAPSESDRKEGAIQIFRLEADKDQRGILRPSRHGPKRTQVLCFSWGRVSRMQWCPIPLQAEDPTRLLGLLCVDGKLRILGIPNVTVQEEDGTFDEVHRPMILLEPPKEYSIEITCFTWINMNRVAAGLSDGSVMVWSLWPLRILQRHPVHSTAIMDIVSGYPSDPFLVSTVPIGGVLSVTDLSRPSAETTYHPNMMVSLQPNLLTWSPHLRGYASMWPSAFAGNPNLTFLPARGFPLCRHLITVTGQPTCVTMGACHPYILTGTTDGSVWVFNILRKLSSHREKTLKLKIFHHEYRPPPSNAKGGQGQESESRGVCRILHGFLPEPNSHPTGVKMAETQRQNRQNKGKGKAKGKTANTQPKPPGQPGQPEGEVDEEAAMTTGPGPIVLYEPLTRITALAWNPNVEFSWWAAAAVGSGLIRIMDLGAEPKDMKKDNGDDEGEGDGGYGVDDMDRDDEQDNDADMVSGDENEDSFV